MFDFHTDRDEPETDLHRLQVATHEVAHYLVWSAMPDARITRVWVRGRGTSAHGMCSVDWRAETPDQDRDYLVGLLAGCVADDLFSDAHPGFRCRRSGQSPDLAVFRKIRRRHEPSRAWSERQLRDTAERLLRADWDRVERLALTLADRGRLKV
ncbi:hypothetical protein [Actinokineospora sp. NBRC 105648]|uniref:hypothetical protein n=1 Tax=Actinokineospora sp. NBRC 105648 TaxID=3032206 RepID=UPI0024A548EC|nr:hypothetical protein [Actinokineospora sp. NBRC 105648]GLZ43515.1 hypothetical protein Acsp05_71390 [Actinokineospora sp. NBRC 105648]